jgi:hypothetical protein
VSEKTRCTADSQVLSGAVTLWTLRNPNLAPRPPIPADLQRRRMEQCAGVDTTGADFNSTQETFVEGVECNQPQLGLRCVTAGAVLM